MHLEQRSHLDPVAEGFADRLDGNPDYRILRALPPPFAAMPANGSPPEGRCIALLDCETTSLDPATGSIIELAIKLVWVDDEGQLLGHFPIFSWLQDPGHPLDPAIARLTRLIDDDLSGRAIDDDAVARLLDRCDLVVAHNARFDRQWIVQRWPDLENKPWACSCSEVQWQELIRCARCGGARCCRRRSRPSSSGCGDKACHHRGLCRSPRGSDIAERLRPHSHRHLITESISARPAKGGPCCL